MIKHTYVVENDLVTITSESGKKQKLGCSLKLYLAGLSLYDNGILIQDAFPFLKENEREFLITGITEEEWNSMFDDEFYN